MPDDEDPASLEELLDRLAEGAAEKEEVSLGDLLEAVGRRSFAPMLLLAGLIALSPLSGIPGMPSTVAVLVIVIAVQLLMKRRHFWLPQWLLRRSFQHRKLDKALKWLRPPARLVDRVLRPRLTRLTHNVGTYGIAVLCVLIALTMPPLELLPFAASAAGAALTTFGLSLIAHDGVVAIIAMIFTVATTVLVVQGLMG